MIHLTGQDFFKLLSAFSDNNVVELSMPDSAQNAILSGAGGQNNYKLINKINGISITQDNSMKPDEAKLKVNGLSDTFFKII